MMIILGSFAQFDRDLINTRIQEGKQWHRTNKKNYKEGRSKIKNSVETLEGIFEKISHVK